MPIYVDPKPRPIRWLPSTQPPVKLPKRPKASEDVSPIMRNGFWVEDPETPSKARESNQRGSKARKRGLDTHLPARILAG
jgi:hypothetical protein